MATVRNGSPRRKAPARKTSRLVDDVDAFIARYVIMTDAQRCAVALWIIHTHLVQHCAQTPYLSITSPEKQCGKSRLLDVLNQLTARPWLVAMPSEAVVYRYIEAQKPTLLLDEVDAIFAPKQAAQHEGLRALLNAGNRRGATVPRALNGGADLVEFSTFCPKALAGIGSLPETIADRSIYIRLRRKRPDEQVERWRDAEVKPGGTALREQIAAWAKQHGRKVGAEHPEMPEQLSDRMQDGCESIVALADALGCGDRARTSLVELLTGVRLDTHEVFRMRLLSDVRDIWRERERATGRVIRGISTNDLLAALCAVEDGPWADYYGRTFESKDLASLLKPYEVEPKPIRPPSRRVDGKIVKGKVFKGYRRADLYDVFQRYVPDDAAGNRVTEGNRDPKRRS
jgi:hypothetical protein